jgi:hypothetical protein
MMTLLASLVLLLQGAADEPPAASATIDTVVKTIPGYKVGGRPVDDEEFLERLTADLVGAAPTAAEIKQFAGDPDPKKRTKRINQLLGDPRFGAFWADRFATVFFGDLSQVRFQGLGPLGEGVEEEILPAFRKWLAARFQKDKPWTEIVGDILDARGSTAGDAALAYKMALYREPGMEQAFAESVPRHFLGIRLTCARCHDHPFDKWRVEDYYGLSAFVTRQRAKLRNGVPEFVYADEGEQQMPVLPERKDGQVKMSRGGAVGPNFLFGGTAGKNDDRMKVLVNFLTNKSNTQLPRALANRVWGWTMGYGVVHPIDDFNLRNKAMSPALLEALVRTTIENSYSLKHLLRVICNTEEYQLPLPQEGQEFESFRHLARRKHALGRYDVYTGKPVVRPASTYTFPESWTPVRPRFGATAKFMHRVPDPKDDSRNAELTIFEGKESREPNAAQFLKPKTATSTVIGKLTFALSEITGITTCRPGADGPLDTTILTARGEASPDRIITFRLEGPTDLVAASRDDFLKLIQSAVLR